MAQMVTLFGPWTNEVLYSRYYKEQWGLWPTGVCLLSQDIPCRLNKDISHCPFDLNYLLEKQGLDQKDWLCAAWRQTHAFSWAIMTCHLPLVNQTCTVPDSPTRPNPVLSRPSLGYAADPHPTHRSDPTHLPCGLTQQTGCA